MELPPPLVDTSDAGLRAAIDADNIAARTGPGDLPRVAHRDADAIWATGQPMDPYANTVACAAFTPEAADARIAEIIAAYDALPSPFLWWRAPFHLPADLGDRLNRARIFQIGEAPAMAADLASLGERPATSEPFEVRGVVDEAGLRDYIAVLAVEPPAPGAPPMFTPEKVEQVVAHVTPTLVDEPAPLRLVGYTGGRPVSAGRLNLGGGAAGIYAIATLAELRGRGFGAAITYAAMATGRDLGYRISTLQATDMGFPVYVRLGFRELFRYAIHVHIPGGARFDA